MKKIKLTGDGIKIALLDKWVEMTGMSSAPEMSDYSQYSNKVKVAIYNKLVKTALRGGLLPK